MRNFKYSVLAPISGNLVSLNEVPDEVFSQEIIGQGVAIIPNKGEIMASFDGVVVSVAQTLHAYTFISNNGLEVLLHIGIDTVELNGLGFETLVESGQKISLGNKIGSFDLNFLMSKKYFIHCPVVVLNKDLFNFEITKKKEVISGVDTIIKYDTK